MRGALGELAVPLGCRLARRVARCRRGTAVALHRAPLDTATAGHRALREGTEVGERHGLLRGSVLCCASSQAEFWLSRRQKEFSLLLSAASGFLKSKPEQGEMLGA